MPNNYQRNRQGHLLSTLTSQQWLGAGTIDWSKFDQAYWQHLTKVLTHHLEQGKSLSLLKYPRLLAAILSVFNRTGMLPDQAVQTGEALLAAVARTPGLQQGLVLDLQAFRKVINDELLIVLLRAKLVTELKLGTSTQLTGRVWEILSQYGQTLERLTLVQMNLQVLAVKLNLAKLSRLSLANLQTLKTLKLDLPVLRHLRVVACDNVTFIEGEVPQLKVATFAKLPKWQRLKLWSPVLRDLSIDGASVLESLQVASAKLKRLFIQDCPRLQPQACDWLGVGMNLWGLKEVQLEAAWVKPFQAYHLDVKAWLWLLWQKSVWGVEEKQQEEKVSTNTVACSGPETYFAAIGQYSKEQQLNLHEQLFKPKLQLN